MKIKDIQTAVENTYENGDGPTKIHHDLGRVVSLTTIKSWLQMFNKTGSINLSHFPSRSGTIRTKIIISKAKYRLAPKKRLSTRRLVSFKNECTTNMT